MGMSNNFKVGRFVENTNYQKFPELQFILLGISS
jgi:hypothetical protein